MAEKKTNKGKDYILPPLTRRMKLAAGMVSAGNKLADIGCDHGYISVYLYKKGVCPAALAADINPAALSRAEGNIERFGARKGVGTRLSDGLKNVRKGEADTVLISGMGGGLIVKILSEGADVLEGARELVLEPQSDAGPLRRYIYDIGFAISDEAFVSERGKYYPVIKAVKSGNYRKLSDEEYEYGPCLLKKRSVLLKEYLLKEEKKLDKIEQSLKSAKEESVFKRAKQLKKEKEVLKAAVKRYEKLILASSSPRRKELLCLIGADPEVIPGDADESADIFEPDSLVEELSRRKCLNVADKIEEGTILGADTVVCVEDEILGKPADFADAERMLRMLSGKIHRVYTGVTLIKKENKRIVSRETFSVKTEVSVTKMSDTEIKDYVSKEKPMDKAGAYAIQGGFAKFIERINGDYFNIVGLPVSTVYARLKKLQNFKTV